MKSGIYQIICLMNDKFYIGSAIDLKQRWSQHKCELNKNIHHNKILQNSWTKYGEDFFNFNVIEYCNIENLIQREQYYLDILRPKFNIAKIAKSWLGVKHTEETKKKMSTIKIGKMHSQETKEKISQTLKKIILYNQKLTNKEILKIRRSNETQQKLANKYGVHQTTISRKINYKRYIT